MFEFFFFLSPGPSRPLEIKIVKFFCPHSQPFLRETCFSIFFLYGGTGVPEIETLDKKNKTKS